LNLTGKTRVVLATGNPGKVREFQQRLEQFFDIQAQSDLGISSPEETGLSFVENAILKARHASKISGMPALADDSGLSVDAMLGAPGIYSARYAGEQAQDAENNHKLLEALKNIQPEDRGAHFVCALVFMRHPEDPQPLICEGNWFGKILQQPAGTNGFGYDPLFLPEGMDCSSAQLAPEMKNSISHRGKAIDKLLRQLQSAD
jgi:XTP/dITP diphosphohydrolase